jgi:methylthioribose-1-phosphate isomerase
MGVADIPRTIWWATDEDTGRPGVYLIDQTRLPLQGDVLACNTYDGVCLAIKSLAVRGAPALGVAAALAVALWSETEGAGLETVEDYLVRLDDVIAEVVATRPTAVNLFWGAARIRSLARGNTDLGLEELRGLVLREALNMVEEDEERNRKLGEYGAELLGEHSKILTHCNAGSLATVYFGTALGVIYTAHEQGKIEHVWVDETRPVNQGGRLTAWSAPIESAPMGTPPTRSAHTALRCSRKSTGSPSTWPPRVPRST